MLYLFVVHTQGKKEQENSKISATAIQSVKKEKKWLGNGKPAKIKWSVSGIQADKTTEIKDVTFGENVWIIPVGKGMFKDEVILQ